MKAAALLLLLLPDAGNQYQVLDALRYLARHQSRDGSWSAGFRDCTCPVKALKRCIWSCAFDICNNFNSSSFE